MNQKSPFLGIKRIFKKIFVDPKKHYNFQFMKKISFFIINDYYPLSGAKTFIKIKNYKLKEIISPEIFIYFFINSDPNLTKANSYPKINPKPNPNPNPNLNP